MSNPTIGFIGYGNMAQAIADKLEKTTMKVGAKPLHNAAEVVAASDMVVIAIKPYRIESVIKPVIGAIADEDKFVVSIAAGWDLDKYRDLFGADFNAAHIQCTIPNTPMAVGTRHRSRQHADRHASRSVRAAVLIDQPHRTR